jgi:hypothetical protein
VGWRVVRAMVLLLLLLLQRRRRTGGSGEHGVGHSKAKEERCCSLDGSWLQYETSLNGWMMSYFLLSLFTRTNGIILPCSLRFVSF